jgi:preprotein translocase subunit SecF
VLNTLKETGTVQMRRIEFVGPQVGDELFAEGSLAMLIALLGILIYVMLRFEWRLAVGTIAATFHDVIFTIGVFSLFQIEVDLTVLAAVLTVIGYSVNDTVVVLDRIRENFRKMRKETTREVMNASINQTLSRTLMTGVTALMAVAVLLIFGGSVLYAFSLALLIGIIVGTYSSIYIASASALMLGVSREDLLTKVKETVDDRP